MRRRQGTLKRFDDMIERNVPAVYDWFVETRAMRER